MARFGFVGGSYQGDSLDADSQRAVNIYAELVESGAGKNRYYYRQRPGLELFCTLPTGPVRALFADAHLWAVAGSKLYSISADGTYAERGDVGNDAYNMPAQILMNHPYQLLVVSGGYAWIKAAYGSADPPVKCAFTGSDPVEYVEAWQAAYLDGFFVVVNGYYGQAGFTSPRRFVLSGLQDGTTWDALDFASKEATPDHIGGVLADHEEMYLFGTHYGSELWRKTGNADMPFERDSSGAMNYGIAASWSAVRIGGGVAWLGRDAERGHVVALAAQGYIPKRVSTHAIEQKWASYPTISDAVGFAYAERGHQFWVLTFPQGNATWAWDAATGLWSEWSTNGGKFLCQTHAYSELGTGQWKHYCGSAADGKVYVLSESVLTDDGQPIRWERTAPHLCDEQVRTAYHRLRVDCETLSADLSWSNNGGRTFGSGRSPHAGDGYLEWRRLGAGRDRVFRLTGTVQAPVRIVDAYLEASGGTT